MADGVLSMMQASDVDGPLTKAEWDRYCDAMRKQAVRPPHPCSLGQHLLNPRALYSTGTFHCAECGYPVDVTIPLSELTCDA